MPEGPCDTGGRGVRCNLGYPLADARLHERSNAVEHRCQHRCESSDAAVGALAERRAEVGDGVLKHLHLGRGRLGNLAILVRQCGRVVKARLRVGHRLLDEIRRLGHTQKGWHSALRLDPNILENLGRSLA